MRIKVPKNFIPGAKRMLCEKVCDVQSMLIIIPDEVKESSVIFEVISKGKYCIDDDIQPGTYIYTGKWAPCHIGFPGHSQWFAINEADVIGVVTEFEKEAKPVDEKPRARTRAGKAFPWIADPKKATEKATKKKATKKTAKRKRAKKEA